MAPDTRDDLLRAGREALVAADWEGARFTFEHARTLAETAEVLDGLSEAAHYQGEHLEAIELKERAFVAYRRQGQPAQAAEAARWLAFLYGAVQGNRAAANGWLAWAERLLRGAEESVEHGRLALDRAPWTDDPAEREGHAMAALTIARRHGDRDLEFAAQAVLGHAFVVDGRVDEGMSLLDEAMAAVSAGLVAGTEAIGSIYCRLLGACERATDVRRAEQWMAAAQRFVAWGDFVAPTCRLHYGGILMAVGRWSEAEEELLAAARAFDRGYRGMRAAPLIRLAALRVRQGRLEEAERLLQGNESRPAARELLAAIALARGDLALAEDLARLCLEGVGGSGPACAPLLELLVGIHLARGEVDETEVALERLAALAARSGGDRTAAAGELATGRVRAAAGDDRARAHLQAAIDAFSALELPLEAARAQLELARALARDAPAGAGAEARLALATFERLGAARDADAAAELLRSLGQAAGRAWPRRSGTLTKRETEVLSLLAAGRSNAEIADRLYISRRTAEHHVANILSKLGLRSRTEAAAYAARERIEHP
ncbi:MAG TPA: LuxR C-terminal-related transcriptional regulator [Solirubrobacteraceae bacterium]|nr:LuxR C-terminal-related transcriptional regulator [Solirubrobacteraceae bacterium]